MLCQIYNRCKHLKWPKLCRLCCVKYTTVVNIFKIIFKNIKISAKIVCSDCYNNNNNKNNMTLLQKNMTEKYQHMIRQLYQRNTTEQSKKAPKIICFACQKSTNIKKKKTSSLTSMMEKLLQMITRQNRPKNN